MNMKGMYSYPKELDDDLSNLVSPSRYTPSLPALDNVIGVWPKQVKDVIYGQIEIPIKIQPFIDSVQFQRLRDLKQLGTTSFVFPCATHNRFEHSIGVSHLAGEFIDRIASTQPELEIRSTEKLCIRIAGLCHDLGHGPFSHAFESWVHTTGKPFHHEDMSIKMLNYLIEDKDLGHDYSTDDIKFIERLITGNSEKDERKYLYDIVANKRNSIDVDKFDYLARDSFYLGRANNLDFKRLIETTRVIDDIVCFQSKSVYDLYELFHLRYSLHKIAYTHKVGKAIEYMISDAFSLADPFLKISDQLDDPREYINLTDYLFNRIETSKEKELEKSREIIKNIKNRNLYKFVDETIFPSEQMAQAISPESIAKEGSGLLSSEIIVENLSLNYAFKDQDPVQQTYFFNPKVDLNKSFIIPKGHISHLIPNQFQEKRIRIFCKNKEKVQQTQVAFRKLLKNHDIPPNPSNTISPMKFAK